MNAIARATPTISLYLGVGQARGTAHVAASLGGDEVDGEEQDDGQHGDQRDDRLQLPSEVGVGAFADGVPDHLHFRGSRVVAQHLPAQQEGVQEPENRDAKDHPEGYGLEHRCVEKM